MSVPSRSWLLFSLSHTHKWACNGLFVLFGQCILERSTSTSASTQGFLEQAQSTHLLQPGPSSALAHADVGRPTSIPAR